MKIGVITPYHDLDNPYFEQCLNSVQMQTHQNLIHIVVGDGCNSDLLLQYPSVLHIPLPKQTSNYGDTPRSIGVVYAFSIGVDAVMFLDSDNWYADKHVETMVAQCQQSNSAVVTCQRYLCHLDGSILGICPESDGVIFNDTNCLLITKALAEEAALWWLIPDDLHAIDDRVMWDTLVHATNRISSTGKPTVYYRTSFAFHYKMFHLEPPVGCKSGEQIGLLGDVIDSLQQRAKQQALARSGK